MRRIIIFFSILSLFFLGCLLIVHFYFRAGLPDVLLLKSNYPVIRYLGPHLSPEIKLSKKCPASWVKIADVSTLAMGAIVVSEDWAFFRHRGYDLNQMNEAFKKDWEKARFARGASTITQQVVRNVFLSQDKNIWRKLKEIYLSTRLEKALGKLKILEVYLNIAEWGVGMYGIGPASFHYFGKAPSELTAKEGAFLAMLLPSPKRYSQSFHAKKLTPYARKTVESILEKMFQAQYLKEEDLVKSLAENLNFEILFSPSSSN